MASLVNRVKSLFQKKANKKQFTAQSSQPQNGAPNEQQQAQQAPQAPQNGAQQQPLQTQQKIATANKATSATTSGTLTVQLQNQTSSSTVYAYISESPAQQLRYRV